MGNPNKSRSIMIRDRKSLTNQIQIIVDYETREIGVVHNKGMEMIVIDSILSRDVEVSYAELQTIGKKEKEYIPINDPFHHAKSPQDCTFATDKPL